MKLALIPPVELLEYTDETWCQLMLPHLLNTNETYRYVYQQHCDDAHQFVILDNGIAEGVEFKWDELMQLADIMRPDEIVIPDVIRDMLMTVNFAKIFRDRHYDRSFRYMFVAQGTTYKEFMQSIDWALDQEWIDTIGLPRHALATTGLPGIRVDMARYVQDCVPTKPVHLLGGSPEYPEELGAYNWPKIVRSTDTSAPFNYAHAGHVFRKGVVVRRPENYFDLPIDSFNEDVLRKNVKKLMSWSGNDLL